MFGFPIAAAGSHLGFGWAVAFSGALQSLGHWAMSGKLPFDTEQR